MSIREESLRATMGSPPLDTSVTWLQNQLRLSQQQLGESKVEIERLRTHVTNYVSSIRELEQRAFLTQHELNQTRAELDRVRAQWSHQRAQWQEHMNAMTREQVCETNRSDHSRPCQLSPTCNRKFYSARAKSVYMS